MEVVTFKQFSRLAAERGWTVDMLTERFQEKIDRPREFFERVMSCKWKNSETGRYEDRSEVVIPYRSVLQFYVTEFKTWQESSGEKAPITDAQRAARAKGAEATNRLRRNLKETPLGSI
jgi:hypothetical protein